MEKREINKKKRRNLDRESRVRVLLAREEDAPFYPTKTSLHGQASLRGNLRSRPGLFPFPRVRRDVSALTMDFTHPLAITRADLSASIVPLSPLFLLRARLLRPLFFSSSPSVVADARSGVPIFCTQSDRWKASDRRCTN